MGSIEPTPDRLARLTQLDGDGPIVMINLLRFAERACYPDDFEAEPCSGQEAYRRYSEVAVDTIRAVGGELAWMGAVESSVIAPDGEEWDQAVLVRYPSREAFLKMIQMPEYRAVAPHRTAALADSRLICSRELAAPRS